MSTFSRSNNILDLIFTTENDRISDLSLIDPLPGCDHFPIIFDYSFSSYAEADSGSRRNFEFNFFKGNYSLINMHLSNIDWDFKFSGLGIEEAYRCFVCILHDTFIKFLSQKQPLNPKKPPWSRSIPNALKQSKRQAWLQYKDARSRFGRLSPIALRLWHVFRSLSVEFGNTVRQCVISYEKSLISSDNSKRFHSYLRSKKVQRPTIGPLVDNEEWVVEPEDMANHFVAAFSAVFTNSDLPNPFPLQYCHNRFLFRADNIDIFKIQKILSNLKPSSSAGPDGIPSVFLKKCAFSISYPLLLLFRKSLSSVSVPSYWKDASVMPLFKGGVHSNPLNYRPISLTSVCCKTFERIIVSQLTSYLEENHLLSPYQYGFRSGRSVSDQLLYTYDYVTQAYDSGLSVDIIFFDFRKAFDVVNHALLLTKLSCIGVEGCVLGWLKDYLSDRKMKVVVHGSQSRQMNVSSGVPQGSVIGPLLFLVYINHAVSQLS